MSLRQRLKTETAPQHRQLEASLNILQRRTRAQYVALLEKFYGFYEPAERQLDASTPELASQLADRRKTPLLIEDLNYFGYSSADLARIPHCRDVPSLDTAAKTVGAFYVYEGSTLGGTFISRHFAQTLHLGREGLAFYRGYGDQTGPMWQAYCELLDQFAGAECEDEVVAAALETFEKLERWLIH